MRSVLVVAGIPGAGKSTWIRRHVDRTTTDVVDGDDLRAAGRAPAFGPARVALHYLRAWRALRGPRDVVVHSRASGPAVRRLLLAMARLTRREAHLLVLDAAPATALAGQRSRGRVVGRARTGRHALAIAPLLADPAGTARREGWASVRVVRREAARITEQRVGANGPARRPSPMVGTG